MICYFILFFSLEGINKVVTPFMACGDLNCYDSDMTYPLKLEDREYVQLPPTQAPIKPPYQTACELKKKNLIQKEGLSINQEDMERLSLNQKDLESPSVNQKEMKKEGD